MVLDAVSNFVRGNTDAAIASGDTTISVADASIFPDPATDGEFNVVIWNASNFPRPDQDANVEIVRVTARDTGTNELTVTRAQEMTTAATHPDGSAIHLSPTAKMFSDIEGTFADFWDADAQELTGDVNNTNTTTETLEAVQATVEETTLNIRGDGDGNINVPHDTFTQIIKDAVDDDFNGYDNSTGAYTIQKSGWHGCLILTDWEGDSSWSNGDRIDTTAAVNGEFFEEYFQIRRKVEDGRQMVGNYLYKFLNEGDTVEFYTRQRSGEEQVLRANSDNDTRIIMRRVV